MEFAADDAKAETEALVEVKVLALGILKTKEKNGERPDYSQNERKQKKKQRGRGD